MNDKSSKKGLKTEEFEKFCPELTIDFISKYSILIEHVKKYYDKNKFDLWEVESESRSIDSVKFDFAILCSNFFISDEIMIKYFDEYMSDFF